MSTQIYLALRLKHFALHSIILEKAADHLSEDSFLLLVLLLVDNSRQFLN
jgi:hypothetical protein